MLIPLPPSLADKASLGNDGNWVTYSIQVGNPPKSFNVLPSTVLPDTWTINTGVCSSLTGNALTNCQANRGFLFSPSMSSTWEYLFDNSSLAFSLGIEGGYGWNPRDGGSFGHDTLILTSEKGSIPVSGSVIGSMNTNATATGFLGLASKQVTLTNPYTNETSITNSTLQILRDTGVIPSMSFSYSAGAIYSKSSALICYTKKTDFLKRQNNWIVDTGRIRFCQLRSEHCPIYICSRCQQCSECWLTLHFCHCGWQNHSTF